MFCSMAVLMPPKELQHNQELVMSKKVQDALCVQFSVFRGVNQAFMELHLGTGALSSWHTKTHTTIMVLILNQFLQFTCNGAKNILYSFVGGKSLLKSEADISWADLSSQEGDDQFLYEKYPLI